MTHDPTLDRLYRYIRANGGVASFAQRLGISAPTLYAKLNGRRRLFPEEAQRIEELTKGAFTRAELIFRNVA